MKNKAFALHKKRKPQSQIMLPTHNALLLCGNTDLPGSLQKNTLSASIPPTHTCYFILLNSFKFWV